jgi:hypothetical protein
MSLLFGVRASHQPLSVSSFIVFCVPFQATIYTMDEWVFGPVFCKVVHFLIFLTMHASIFTLAAVSLDRCVIY